MDVKMSNLEDNITNRKKHLYVKWIYKYEWKMWFLKKYENNDIFE